MHWKFFLSYNGNMKIKFAIVIGILVVVIATAIIILLMIPKNVPTESGDNLWKAKYIHPLEWPPKIQTLNKLFTCAEADRRVVNGHTYCVTQSTEGAAGSIYTQYSYAFARGNQTIVFTFTLRFVQCGNYSEPQKTECENERSSFNLDSIVDRMARTIK